MTAKLLSLVHSKVAIAVLGVLLAGGSGAAVVAASHNQNPSTATDAHSVSINGKLTAYDAGAKTISVQPADASSPTTISVDANTKVNGQHAKSLADLSTAIGHDVQVHADTQSNGALLAWKITVQGDDSSHGTGSGKGKGNGQQHQIAGTIASVGTDSMTSSFPQERLHLIAGLSEAGLNDGTLVAQALLGSAQCQPQGREVGAADVS